MPYGEEIGTSLTITLKSGEELIFEFDNMKTALKFAKLFFGSSGETIKGIDIQTDFMPLFNK